jgi:hypothetical protein
MARLIIKSAGFGDRVIDLNLGVNRFGRHPKCDVQIEHPSVSAWHCDLVLSDSGVVVRDCKSTNGTFIGSRRIQEAPLSAGETLQLGEVELLAETTDVTIAIPKFDMPRPAPPVVLSDGSLVCPRHPKARVTHQCTHCREVLCDACVHRLRRRGGNLMTFCPFCSHACVLLGEEKPKKKSFLGLWRTTTRLPFLRGSKKSRRSPSSDEDA